MPASGCDAYRGGTVDNNADNCGLFYLNLNNGAANTNWNIGAAHSYHMVPSLKVGCIPRLLPKINSRKASVSSEGNPVGALLYRVARSKVDERIRRNGN